MHPRQVRAAYSIVAQRMANAFATALPARRVQIIAMPPLTCSVAPVT